MLTDGRSVAFVHCTCSACSRWRIPFPAATAADVVVTRSRTTMNSSPPTAYQSPQRNCGTKPLCHFHKEFVSGVVTVGVIHELELVDVHVEQCGAATDGVTRGDDRRQSIVQFPSDSQDPSEGRGWRDA